ncbi:TIR domain-containing adapter molecule 1 [Fukomys damarensis]|uniref:TIR domain-containing adapter molecule 1 n=1 Tax=Fukomys damarensis TaxID=885580 RepID=UPI00054010C7|nr:TIR domain-containing adapter molecule 1 [Fukomys damarensis]
MACPGPSLPGAFDLLAATGPDELVALRHKLQTVYRGRRGADLLHTMVLLQLGRGTEARISLDALKADTVARAVARQWAVQDAIDHSGFVILLMTPNFDSALSLHQVNQALTSSFTHHGRRDSVVPFLPLESAPGLQRSDTSRLLSGLVWLDERSKIFSRKVGNTFKPQRLWERRAHWQREQDVRARLEARQRLDGERQQAEALHAQHSAYLQSYLAWQAQMDRLKADFGSHLSLGTQVPYPAQRPFGVQGPWGTLPPFPGWPGCPQPPTLPPGHPGSSSPAFPQPPTFPPASSAPPQTPLIIHHAQMVQLGINNHMWNQRGAQAPEDTAPEVERLRDQA